jgi:hypothetical protein
VATGRLFNEAALLLQNHSRRRVSAGRDFALVVADDIGTATKELKMAVESVSQRVVAEHLCYLDNTVGLNVSRLLLTKFNLSTPSIDHVTESLTVPKTPLALAASATAQTSAVTESTQVYEAEIAPAEPYTAEPETPPVDSEHQVHSDTYVAWDNL